MLCLKQLSALVFRLLPHCWNQFSYCFVPAHNAFKQLQTHLQYCTSIEYEQVFLRSLGSIVVTIDVSLRRPCNLKMTRQMWNLWPWKAWWSVAYTLHERSATRKNPDPRAMYRFYCTRLLGARSHRGAFAGSASLNCVVARKIWFKT